MNLTITQQKILQILSFNEELNCQQIAQKLKIARITIRDSIFKNKNNLVKQKLVDIFKKSNNSKSKKGRNFRMIRINKCGEQTLFDLENEDFATNILGG